MWPVISNVPEESINQPELQNDTLWKSWWDIFEDMSSNLTYNTQRIEENLDTVFHNAKW